MFTKKFNPAPLGLAGFALPTILLNIHNAKIIPMSIVVVSLGLMVGGIGQLIAGILEFREKNTFGGVVFTMYGLFWLSLVYIWKNDTSFNLNTDAKSMGFYLLLWGIFTLFMTIAAWNHNTISKLVFTSLTMLFFLLAISDFTGFTPVVAGVVGIFSGLFALYNSVAIIINNEKEKVVLPL